MAAPLSMDAGEPGGELGKGSKSGGSLAVNKSSNKIRKGLRPTVAQPRLAPTVYKTEPSDFRSLVQQLTGTSHPPAASPTAPKPVNSRLSRIAPPPLRPTLTYPSATHPQPQTQPQTQSQTQPPSQPSLPPSPGSQIFNTFGSFSPLSKQGASPFGMSPLSFSPLPQLSPSDQGWVNALTGGLESPATRQLAQAVADGVAAPQGVATKQEPGATAGGGAHPPPLSPTFASLRFSPSSFGLPSPSGFPSPSSFGNMFNNVYGMSNFTPTAALQRDVTFSFPEPDISMSPAGTP